MDAHIIDTHIHIWNLQKGRYDWLKNDTSILHQNYAIADLESSREVAGVTGGVLVQAANNFEDTDAMLEIAAATPWIYGVVGWLPLNDPAKTEKLLSEKYLKNIYFKGVRHLIHDEPDEKWLLQQPVIESLRFLAAQNVPYDFVGIHAGHIRTALKVWEKVPELKMVFDHMNRPPDAIKKEYTDWSSLMKEAAKNQNYFAKISGLGKVPEGSERWSDDYIKPHIVFALEHFGADRCMCGGNWPVSLLKENYVAIWKSYKSIITSLLDDAGKEKLLAKNAVKFYNLAAT